MDAMDVRTFRASTMHEALAIVRRELGPDAAILRTREIRVRRLFGLLPGRAEIEVTASVNVNVPSRLPPSSSPLGGLNRECRESVVETGLSLERASAETRALVMRTGAFHPEVQHRLENMEQMLRTL
ncbi:MAG TPA: hypothetical protein PKI05_12235, partial [Thermogutta sp.]|nr:hypothetical protein [Thermogutta sp.]